MDQPITQPTTTTPNYDQFATDLTAAAAKSGMNVDSNMVKQAVKNYSGSGTLKLVNGDEIAPSGLLDVSKYGFNNQVTQNQATIAKNALASTGNTNASAQDISRYVEANPDKLGTVGNDLNANVGKTALDNSQLFNGGTPSYTPTAAQQNNPTPQVNTATVSTNSTTPTPTGNQTGNQATQGLGNNAPSDQVRKYATDKGISFNQAQQELQKSGQLQGTGAMPTPYDNTFNSIAAGGGTAKDVTNLAHAIQIGAYTPTGTVPPALANAVQNYVSATKYATLKATYTPYQLSQATYSDNNGDIFMKQGVDINSIPRTDPKVTAQKNSDTLKGMLDTGLNKGKTDTILKKPTDTTKDTTGATDGTLPLELDGTVKAAGTTTGNTGNPIVDAANAMYQDPKFQAAQTEVNDKMAKLKDYDAQLGQLEKDIRDEASGEASSSLISALVAVKGADIMKLKTQAQNDLEIAQNKLTQTTTQYKTLYDATVTSEQMNQPFKLAQMNYENTLTTSGFTQVTDPSQVTPDNANRLMTDQYGNQWIRPNGKTLQFNPVTGQGEIYDPAIGTVTTVGNAGMKYDASAIRLLADQYVKDYGISTDEAMTKAQQYYTDKGMYIPGFSQGGVNTTNINTGTNTSSTTSIAEQNNNPGNIKWGDFAKSMGAVDSGIKATDGGTFAKFPDTQSGLDAQKSLFTGKTYSNLTLDGALGRWSNNGYNTKSLGLNIDPNTKVKDLSDAQLTSVFNAMNGNESGNKNYGQQGGATTPTTPTTTTTGDWTTKYDPKVVDAVQQVLDGTNTVDNFSKLGTYPAQQATQALNEARSTLAKPFLEAIAKNGTINQATQQNTFTDEQFTNYLKSTAGKKPLGTDETTISGTITSINNVSDYLDWINKQNTGFISGFINKINPYSATQSTYATLNKQAMASIGKSIAGARPSNFDMQLAGQSIPGLSTPQGAKLFMTAANLYAAKRLLTTEIINAGKAGEDVSQFTSSLMDANNKINYVIGQAMDVAPDGSKMMAGGKILVKSTVNGVSNWTPTTDTSSKPKVGPTGIPYLK